MSDDYDLFSDEDELDDYRPPDDAMRQWLEAMQDRGLDIDEFGYVGFNFLSDGEALRGTVFNSPGEAFDYFHNAGIPNEMVHVVWTGDDSWQCYISGSP